MPRPRLAPRLWFEEPTIDKKTGKVRQGEWCILDAGAKHRTGCAKPDSEGAGRALQAFLEDKYNPKGDTTKDPAKILISDVLVQYAQERGMQQAHPKILQSRLAQLIAFWENKTLSEITPQKCRDYVTCRTSQFIKNFKPEVTGSTPKRISSDTARRELTDLRSAINHHYAEGRCSSVVKVLLPEAGEAHADYLLRGEAARLVWAARTIREEQGGRETKRRTTKHLVRFMLLGLYTGSRHGTLLTASFKKGPGRSYIDMKHGLFYRKPEGKTATKKRQETI